MNRHFDRALVHAELAGSFRLRKIFGVAGEPRFERFELLQFSSRLMFLRPVRPRRDPEA